MIELNVTELHICQKCPRLLAYSIHKNEKQVWKIGLQGNYAFPGTKFHRIAQQFHMDASGRGDPRKKEALIYSLSGIQSDLKENFLGFLRINYFIPFLNEQSSDLTEDQLTSIAYGVEKWGNYLLNFLTPHLIRNNDVQDVVYSIFHRAEVLLSYQYLYTDGKVIKIRGKPDALLFDPETKEAVILEFKGRKISEITEEIAQTSLYAWLVQQEIGITPRIEILYLDEDDPLVKISSNEVNHTIGNLIFLFESARKVWSLLSPLPPACNKNLCTQCRFNNYCEQDLGNITQNQEKEKPYLLSPSIPPSEQEKHTDIDEDTDAKKQMNDLIKTLDLLKLPVTSEGYISGPRFIRLKIKPVFSKGVTVNKILNKVYDLQVALNLHVPPLIQPQGGYVSVDVPRKVREPLTLGMLFDPTQSIINYSPSDANATFPLGMGIDGSIFHVNLAEPTMTSILIGGTSGSGKSELLRSIIIGLALSAHKDSLSFTLIDPKRVTFTDFSTLPCLDGKVLMDADLVINRLNQIVQEMEGRYRLFEEEKVHDINSYNHSAKESLKRRVIVVDEYADLIINKDTKEALEIAIQRIGQKGRAAGFHLILATQRPDAKVVTGVIKANLQLKICLKVTSSTNSRIILDDTGGEYLIGHGDMLVGGSIAIQRLQGPLVTGSDIKRLKNMYEYT